MAASKKIGIIICDRYSDCVGGKCFRALNNREGAFDIYKDMDVEIMGYASCGGCPGGNFEYAPEEMKKNGVEVIHLATGLVVGYPPCSHIEYFEKLIRTKFELDVVIGTHPIPKKYITAHSKLGTWDEKKWERILKPTLKNEATQNAYN